MNEIKDIEELITLITETNTYFQKQVQKQVNVSLTLRNWFFGFYLVEYELTGADRAQYGKQVMKEVARRAKHVKGFAETNLHLFKTFYLAYPQIFQLLTEKLQLSDFKGLEIFQSLTEKLGKTFNTTISTKSDIEDNNLKIDINKLINQLSFTHFIELIKAGTPAKRIFYEVETLKNNWTVRELQRAMNSMLYERTGLSQNKDEVIKKHIKGEKLAPEDLFRNPYVLEFLGLEEKSAYTENDLERAIINHLQTFLLEAGRGFCFETKQKRITFDNTHYYIDLVFYHRILKCHILIDLKLGDFDHADAGQMNVYLNYYKENEKHDGDNEPVGIILCASQNENLVKYATAGLPQKVFVSKYLINLPSEAELAKIIEEEQDKIK
jgi:predicted nuclease of restriction endonuclease-like (RecB) superfamily